ncbi:acetolactate synthase, large subunit [Terriglobus roseus]|uniref:Acetolactate synthase, large subunit n=1 Tax=Terriglobus roseus TaxID=392734 RepID=A0A1H4J1R7_9BACT|nr:acetolactate synthase, large subunit [Terriglobus roseus]
MQSESEGNTGKTSAWTRRSAHLLVQGLTEQRVSHIFGIPGGKIMPVFDAMLDIPDVPKLIVCRHEQNAGFMSAAVGRLTGRPGVCLVTSGPGTSNLVTAAATATSEGDPMVAIGGVVPLTDTLKQVHQTMDSVTIMKPVTKYSAAIPTPEAAGEVVANAFAAAVSPRAGAAFLAFPQDVQSVATDIPAMPWSEAPRLGAAPSECIHDAALTLRKAKLPVLLLGMGASEPAAVSAIRAFLTSYPMATVGTYQGAGTVSRDLTANFHGRIGLFRNQPGDKVLALSDVVLTIGYDPVEYGPDAWNAAGRATILHLDDTAAVIDNHYQPQVQLIGDVSATMAALAEELGTRTGVSTPELQAIQQELRLLQTPPARETGPLVHPLHFVLTLRELVDDSTVIASDMGSHHIWMARHFFEYEPRRLLFSNGQQTLGVGIPWAMAASFLYPGRKAVATVGDGGFLYSSMELETAVRHKLNLTVFVFRDGGYNMVAFQQQLRFGRTSGVQFGNPDLVRYAESMGAIGMRVETPSSLRTVIEKALNTPGVVVVDMPVDYSHNLEIGQHVLPNAWD